MKNNINIWLERLSSLYRSQLRQAAANVGIQSVHLEILQYLSICNAYSNTAQALSEYLGQTKGSISQSLKIMEKSGHIERQPCPKDKRFFKLHLTESGKECLKKASKDLLKLAHQNDQHGSEQETVIKSLLKNWQQSHSQEGFGQCLSCRYNESQKNQRFKCGLTGEKLKKSETLKICREHQFNSSENSL